MKKIWLNTKHRNVNLQRAWWIKTEVDNKTKKGYELKET
jgi:hypothetical protein